MDDWEKADRTLEHLGMQEALEPTSIMEDELLKGFDEGLAEGIIVGKEEGRQFITSILPKIREFQASQ